MVSHTYPPPSASRTEEPVTAISPLGNRPTGGDAQKPLPPRVTLVEDRLVGDRRNLPAPPSHRAAPPQQDQDLTSPLPAGRPGAGLSPLTATLTGVVVADDPRDLLTSVLPAGHRSITDPGLDGAVDINGGAHRAEQTTGTGRLAPTRQKVEVHSPYEDPFDEPTVGRLALSRRIMRGGLVVGLVAAVGALMFAMPEDDGAASVETAAPDAAPLPLATAEMLDNSSLDSVDVSLGASDSLRSIASSAYATRTGSPADTPDGFGAAVADVVGEATAPATTTTTVWVEPPLPPESEWANTGNGVLVPDVLLRIRFCESTNNYAAANTGSSARGAYQFLTKSWDWYGHAEITGVTQAHLATPAQQDEAALRTLQSQGTGPWAESRACWNSPDIAPNYATAAPPAPATTVPPSDDGDGDGETTDPDGETTTTVEGQPTTTVPDGETETTVEGETTTTVEGETTTTTAPSEGGEETTTTTTQP